MSLVSFLKDAGEKLFGGKAAQAAAPTAAPAQPDTATLNETAGQAIEKYIAAQNLTAENLDVKFDGASSTVTVSGVAPDQATKEKILLCCGNVSGVEKVNDLMTVAKAAEPPSRFHTVVRGDTLSAIAKTYYGNANKYPQIFEANKPMLTHPDKIYPGQVLRIPG